MSARLWVVIGENGDGGRFVGVFSSHRRAARASTRLLDRGIQPDVYQLPRVDRFGIFDEKPAADARHWLSQLNAEPN